MKSPEPTQTFAQLLREGNRYTDRDLMKVLGVGHGALKQREADPSRFTMGELARLAKLLGKSTLELVKLVLAEMERNPQVVEQVLEATSQVVGRKNYPRAPKAAKAAPEA
jgi:transcriptional regulator with XRE-family HTH domain